MLQFKINPAEMLKVNRYQYQQICPRIQTLPQQEYHAAAHIFYMSNYTVNRVYKV